VLLFSTIQPDIMQCCRASVHTAGQASSTNTEQVDLSSPFIIITLTLTLTASLRKTNYISQPSSLFKSIRNMLLNIPTLAALLTALATTTTALGCYEPNTWYLDTYFRYGHLHSDPSFFPHYIFGSPQPSARDLNQEVRNDIVATCKLVENAIFHGRGSHFSHCSNWATEVAGLEDRGNRIDWDIKYDGDGTDSRTLTFETCQEAFEAELAGCEHGSDQNHDGFWFRIDPNPGKCPA
jgi:hypothetical protein